MWTGVYGIHLILKKLPQTGWIRLVLEISVSLN